MRRSINEDAEWPAQTGSANLEDDPQDAGASAPFVAGIGCECDHVNGMRFIDHISTQKQDRARET